MDEAEPLSSYAESVLKAAPTSLLREQVLLQTEYLFSRANLLQDRTLRKVMDKDASRQGTCTAADLLELKPRLRYLVAELATRDRPAAVAAKSFSSAEDEEGEEGGGTVRGRASRPGAKAAHTADAYSKTLLDAVATSKVGFETGRE